MGASHNVVARRTEIAGLSLGSFSALCFGTLAISAKFAYDDGAGPLPLLAVRFTIASVLLVGFHLVTGRRLWIGRNNVVKLVVMGAFGYGLEASLFFAALERAPAGIVGLVFYSYPMWTAIIGFATKVEPFRFRTVAALAMGTLGVALVFSLPHASLSGPLLALTAAVAVAIYFVVIQVVLANVDPSAAALWTTVGAAAGTWVAQAVARQPLPPAALTPALALGIASAVAFVALYAAIVRIGSARAAVAAMLEPVTTLVLAAIFLNETITGRVVVGAALVVAALPVLASTKKTSVPAADSA
ncbi:MAG TPA: DMT family transporter [Actinomycetota bacterium]|nr:DMT family transporter [Actinomycetota bacterium]